MIFEHLSTVFADIWNLVSQAIEEVEDKVMLILYKGMNLHVVEPGSQYLIVESQSNIL